MTDPQRVRQIYDRFAPHYERRGRWFKERYLEPLRRLVIPRARGRVLELGIGNGETVPHYRPEAVGELIGVDVSGRMLAFAREKLSRRQVPFSLLQLPLEAVDFPRASFDTVVSSLVMCGVDDQREVFARVRQWLRPEGEFLLIEHVRGRGPVSGALCDLLNPMQLRVAGCELSRNTFAVLSEAGFEVEMLGESFFSIFRAAVARPRPPQG